MSSHRDFIVTLVSNAPRRDACPHQHESLGLVARSLRLPQAEGVQAGVGAASGARELVPPRDHDPQGTDWHGGAAPWA